MTFARPWLLVLLIGLAIWWWRRRRVGDAVAYSDVSLPAAVARSPWWTRLPPILRGLALTAWIVGAAGLRLGGDTVETKQEGIAIVIAIDISSSMLAEDFAPSNRLEVAKKDAVGFIRGREADRIGLPGPGNTAEACAGADGHDDT